MCQEQVLATDSHKVESFSKTIENLSTLFDDIRKESYAVSDFEKAMIDFVKSATNLMGHWENLPRKIEPQITEHTRYPFQMSFDELVYEMYIWLEATQSRIKLWKEGK
jgi:hypothetical protein